jgi:hypothetical protein
MLFEEHKISLDEKETYECLSKEYGEGLTEDDVSAARDSQQCLCCTRA